MASETFDTSRLLDALRLADLLLTSIREWICMRRQTIHKLKNVASELNDIKKNVNVTKIAGSTVSVVGGSLVLASLFAIAAPIAVPLVVCGTITSLVGGIASGGGDIIGTHVSQKRIEEAQKMMDQEKEVLEKIEKITKELEMKTNQIETRDNPCRESLYCAVLIASQCEHVRLFDSSSNTLTFQEYMRNVNRAMKFTQSYKLLQNLLTKTVANTSVKGVAQVAKNILRGVVFRGIAIGAAMIWDIAELVHTAVDINKGSTTDAASDLFKMADEYEVQMNESLAFLTELEKRAADFQIQEMFRNISIKGHATDVQMRYVLDYLEKRTSDVWKLEVRRLALNMEFVVMLSSVFQSLLLQIVGYDEKNEENGTSNDIQITIIGHGGIRLPMIQCGFHYLNHAVKSVTLFEPWGCAIDASVVYGIMTGTLQHQNVYYTGNLYQVMQTGIRQVTEFVDQWNILPNAFDLNTTIPTIELTPVIEGEQALEELRQIMGILSSVTRGLVIPYFPGFNRDILPFTAIPLCVICQAVGLICEMINKRCDIHVACCLSVQDTNIIRDLENVQIVNVHQYLTVLHQRPPHLMTNLVFPEALRTRLAPLNRFL